MAGIGSSVSGKLIPLPALSFDCASAGRLIRTAMASEFTEMISPLILPSSRCTVSPARAWSKASDRVHPFRGVSFAVSTGAGEQSRVSWRMSPRCSTMLSYMPLLLVPRRWLGRRRAGDILRLRDTRGSKRRLMLTNIDETSGNSAGFVITAAKTTYLATGTVLTVDGTDEPIELGELPPTDHFRDGRTLARWSATSDSYGITRST